MGFSLQLLQPRSFAVKLPCPQPDLKSCMTCTACQNGRYLILLSLICTIWYTCAEHWVVIYMQCSFLIYIRVCEVCGYCSYIESSSADICVCQHQECDMTQLQLWLLLVWCASPSNSSKPQHHLQQSWTVFCSSCRASSQSDLQNAASAAKLTENGNLCEIPNF